MSSLKKITYSFLQLDYYKSIQKWTCKKVTLTFWTLYLEIDLFGIKPFVQSPPPLLSEAIQILEFSNSTISPNLLWLIRWVVSVFFIQISEEEAYVCYSQNNGPSSHQVTTKLGVNICDNILRFFFVIHKFFWKCCHKKSDIWWCWWFYWVIENQWDHR